jgi:hypothetical protein
MREQDRRQLRDIVGRLQDILDELHGLELRAEDPLIRQVSGSAGHALRWIGLADDYRPQPESEHFAGCCRALELAESEFLRGFAETCGAIDPEAQWAGWSRHMSDAEREKVESEGYKRGRLEGQEFAEWFRLQF